MFTFGTIPEHERTFMEAIDALYLAWRSQNMVVEPNQPRPPDPNDPNAPPPEPAPEPDEPQPEPEPAPAG